MSMSIWLMMLVLLGADPAGPRVSTVTSAVPFPRGLAVVDGELHVLARGRVRGQGGADATLDDRAGTIFVVDPDADPATNVRVVAEPGPPMRLLRRDAIPATLDAETDRPYCTLRWHEATRSFYICAFSGIDKADVGDGTGDFRKNATDAVLRFDTRTGRWYELDRHEPGRPYPMEGGRGLLKGPDNLLVVGDTLYVAAKDNHLVAAYDLSPLIDDPEATVGPGRVVLGRDVPTVGGPATPALGPSGLASDGTHLFVAYRTSGEILRLPLDDLPAPATVLARFPAWDQATGVSADLTDLSLGPDGHLYAVTAQPAKIHRVPTEPAAELPAFERPWFDLAAAVGRPRLKAENLLVDASGRVLVTTGDAYNRSDGLAGTVYMIENGHP